MTEIRINPLIEVPRDELTSLAGEPIAHIERIDGGLTNTIHRVVTAGGDTLAIKHYTDDDSFDTELVTLTLLHGTVPVPDVVRADRERRALVYRWIDGITLNDLRKRDPDAVGSLAEPLGRVLAWLAATDATEAFELAPILALAQEQLADGPARRRLGAPLSDAMRRGFQAFAERLAWGTVCLVHGDFGGRNLIVEPGRVVGVIDWEATTTGSPLADIGSLFRYAHRHDPAFRAGFERGYRDAGGTLPDDWLLVARILDATWLVDTLDDERERPGIFADCRMLIAKLVAELV